VRLLLDTHVLVWLTETGGDLAASKRAEIDAAAQGDGLLVSSITFWEVAMLAGRGRITLGRPIGEWRDLTLALQGLSEVPIDNRIALEAAVLPEPLHGDPADRLLIATARLANAHLMTRDARILAYAKCGHLSVVEA
jgi:PIN domain nuclease of toxin-antitoxin system